MWIPSANWNGKFQAVGNGAFNGNIAYPAMATALGRGYATSSTDTGHVGNTASFAMGHPEKVIDFGWRAVHEMTVVGQVDHQRVDRLGAEVFVLERVLGRRPSGAQGSAALSRRISTASWPERPGSTGPAARRRRCGSRRRCRKTNRRAVRRQGALLHAAVLEACDAGDGVKDGVIDDPTKCRSSIRE